MKRWAFGTRQKAIIPTASILPPRMLPGIVEKHNQNGTIAVRTHASRYHAAAVLPQGWCYPNADKKISANISLPPIDSHVFCLITEEGIAFVLCGWPLALQDEYKEIIEQQDNDREVVRTSIWQRILDRGTGKWTLLHDQDDAKYQIEIDPENQRISATDFHENQYRSDEEQQEFLAKGNVKISLEGDCQIENKSKLSIAVEGDCNIESQAKVVIEASAIELGGDAKELVTHAELQSAIEAIIATIKTHTHNVATSGGPSAQTGTAAPSTDLATMQLNMDGAKAAKLKVG